MREARPYSGKWVKPALIPGIAAQDTFEPHPTAFGDAILLDGLVGV
jgi:hypothetical protein